jgi:paspaline synthase
MDGFNNIEPPEAYQEVKWIADIFVTLMGVGWIINYGSMLKHAYTDSTYSMALLPLCSNIGWEMTFVLIYPSPYPYEFAVFASLLTLNLGIMVTAARVAPAEWAHSPLVAQNLHLIFLTCILVCFTGHVALAAQIGPNLAYSWGAFICQLSLSVGASCQLLQRNSTRGTSWSMW